MANHIMEPLISLKNYFIYTFKSGSMGFSLLEILFIIFFFILAFFLRSLFAKIIIRKIKIIVQKTSNKVDDNLFDALASPLKALPIIFIFILMGFFNKDDQLSLLLQKINQSLITIFVFWLLHQSLSFYEIYFKKLEEIFSKALVVWLVKSLKYLFIFLGVVAVLEIWGIKIGPVIAGLGLFGVAVALGAQDLFKNLISGIIIIFEKRFKLNDTIEVPGQALGTVEHIGFRSTLIRKFDSTPISIPNYVFSDTSIINYSERYYRRIQWIIGLTYDTSIDQLKSICSDLESSIKLNQNYIVNDFYKLNIRVEKFNDSSIDILINTFTNTNDWEKYLEIKEELIFTIKNTIEKYGCSFAYPSQSIYIERT